MSILKKIVALLLGKTTPTLSEDDARLKAIVKKGRLSDSQKKEILKHADIARRRDRPE